MTRDEKIKEILEKYFYRNDDYYMIMPVDEKLKNVTLELNELYET